MQIVVITDGSGLSLEMVQGRPLVDWQLDCFASSGAHSVVLCVGQDGESLETHVRRALDRGLTVGYSYDGGQRLGSGGLLRRAYARLEPEFVVADAARYLPFDYAAPLHDLQAHSAALATLSVSRGAGGVALEGDEVTSYGETAAAHASYGAFALRRSALDAIEDGAVWNLDVLLRRLARQRKLRALLAVEPGYDARTTELERHLASLPREL